MATLEEVSKIMAVMALSYPRYELNKGTIKVYADLLKTIPQDILEAAAKEVMVSNTFFPSLAELRNKALDLMVGLQNIPSAFEAWKDAISEINRCGDYYRYSIRVTEPKYSHPLVEQAVNIMGYRNLCESENIVADRAHFFRVYESLLERAKNDMRMLPESRAISEKYRLETNGSQAIKRLV